MTIEDLIRPHLDKTDAEIVAILNAATVTKTDSQRWTWAGLAVRFNPTVVGTIDEVLKAVPGMDWVRMQLAGSGIDFSLPTTQAALESLRAVPQLAAHIDNLKAVGVYQMSPWVNAGFSGTVSEQAIADARLIVARDTRFAEIDAWQERAITLIRSLRADQSKTLNEIKAAVGALA